LLFGYDRVEFAPLQDASSQPAFVAVPEKALLDLLYLEPHSATPEYIRELRLQNLESLNLERLNHFTEITGSPKLRTATALITDIVTRAPEYADLESVDAGFAAR
jgi:hypothetical protein